MAHQLLAAVLLAVALLVASVDASRMGSFLSSTAASDNNPNTSPWGLLTQRLSHWVPDPRSFVRTECDAPEWRKTLPFFIKEMPFLGLFVDIKGTTKFEASGMTIAPGPDNQDWLWVVFDNLHALGRVDEQFEFKDPRNALVGELGDDSQFEGLTYSESKKLFYAVEEVFDDEDHGFHPFVHEIRVDSGKTYKTVSRCPVHYVLTHENKGFEGLHLHEHNDHSFLLGLCEGNYCVGGSQGREPGNGRIVVTKHNGLTGDECGWNVEKIVDIPSSAAFIDYSGMAFRGNKAAIISQESSAMWVGTFDFEAMEFTSEGTVYHFPRDNECEMIYCNVEGIQWLDDVRFVVASDKAKSRQPLRCVQHDQRLTIFALPDANVHSPDERK